MSRFKKTLATVFLLAIGVSAHTAYKELTRPLNVQKLKGLPKLGEMSTKTPKFTDSVIMLATPDNDPFCSGTIIDKNYILTAAHCLYDDEYNMSTKEIHILDGKGEYTNVTAKAAAIDIQRDYAVLLGNFEEFAPLPVLFNSIEVFIDAGAAHFACGYPEGSPGLFCSPISSLTPRYFGFIARGLLYPGMSGGPTLVFGRGGLAVIAVNTAVEAFGATGVIVVSPLIGLRGSFKI